jgi:hypothetical protein
MQSSHRRSLLILGGLFLLGPFVPGAEKPGTLPPAPLVTLTTEKVPRSRLLAELAGRGGLEVRDALGADAPIQVKVQRATPWQALDAIAAASSARVDFSSRDGRVALVKRTGPGSLPVSYDGPFRIAVQQVVARRDLEAGQSNYTVTLYVAWLPRLLPLYLETQPQGLRVVAENGKGIPHLEEGSSPAPVDGRTSFAFEVPLPALPRSAQVIGELEGKLSAVVPTHMLTLDFGSLEKLAGATGKGPVIQKKDGVTCRVDRVLLAADRWTLRVSVELPPGSKQFDSYQTWAANNELTLVSPDGKKRSTPSNYVIESSSSRKAVISYHFTDRPGHRRGQPSDWNVNYRTPALLVEVPFAFRFKDVPLP